MSYYYTYYCGYQTPDNLVRPLGPFNYKGELRPVMSESRNYCSDLNCELIRMPEAWISDELKAVLEYEVYNDEKVMPEVRYLYLDEVKNDDPFIKSGFFLMEEVQEYIETQEADFYESLTAEQYAFKLENELKFGVPKPALDAEGNPFEFHSCSEYQYYAYPDYTSKGYDIIRLNEMFESLDTYNLPKDSKLIVFEVEG